jgi:hypothetical protein
MMTALEMLQAFGIVLVATLSRAALVLAVVMALSVPLIVFAYTVRAAEAFWHRHHVLAHHHA